jgi:hypothetical protein
MSRTSDAEVCLDREVRQESVSELIEYSISFNEDNTLVWNPPVGSKELAIALSYHFPKEEKVEKKMQAATMKFLRAEHQKPRVITPPTSGESDTDNGPESGDCPSKELPTACDTPKKYSRANDQSDISQDANSDLSASIVFDKAKPELEDKGKAPRNVTPDELTIVSWAPGTKVPHRGKKRRYGSQERVKVASNRGYACDKHRRQKVKVRKRTQRRHKRYTHNQQCDPDVCSRNKQNLLAPVSSQKRVASSVTERAMRAEADASKRKEMDSELADNSDLTICPTAHQPVLDQTPFSPLQPNPTNPVRIGLSEVDMAWKTFSQTPMEFSPFGSTFVDDQRAFEASVDMFYFPVVPHCDLEIKSVDPTLCKLQELMGGLIRIKLDDA